MTTRKTQTAPALHSFAVRLWPFRARAQASWTSWQRRDWWFSGDVETTRRRWYLGVSTWRRWESEKRQWRVTTGVHVFSASRHTVPQEKDAVHVTLMTGTMVATTEQTASAVPVRPLLQISVPSALCPDYEAQERARP